MTATVHETDPAPVGGYYRDQRGNIVAPSGAGWRFVYREDVGPTGSDEPIWCWREARARGVAFPLTVAERCRECRRIPLLRHKMDCSRGR